MQDHEFFVCLDNRGYEVSLEVRKIYKSLPDSDARNHGQIRVIDESGEDYLYPESMFAPIDLPDTLAKRLIQAA